MFGFPILEVAIGLCFVYLLLSFICTTVNETIVALTGRRGKMLAGGIETLLGDADLKDKVYSHPLIKSLTQGGSKPSYIPSDKFALALMDIVTGEGKSAGDPQALRQAAGLDAFKESGDLRKTLNTVLVNQAGHLANDQQKIADWYDHAMDRLSGAYKRRTTLWVWGLALIITLMTNADTVRITRVLWSNQAVRSAVVNAAQSRAQQTPPEPMPLVEYKDPNSPDASEPLNVNIKSNALTEDERKMLGELMMGWNDDLEQKATMKASDWWGPHLLGWFFTMVALTLGAPFWYDTLNKFINLRNAGKPATPAQAPAETPAQAAAAKGAGAS
jgi:hypothetical protein